MIDQKWSASDMLKAWDRNGDRQIQRMEFRIAINQMGIDVSHVKVDALFDKIDLDAGGSIDEAELRQSAKLMHDAATAARSEHSVAAARLEYCRERLKLVEACYEPAMEVEAAHVAHRTLCDSRCTPLDARVGEALSLLNQWWSLAELASKWDSDGSGCINRADFVRRVRLYKNSGQVRIDGSSAEAEEQLAQLYESLRKRLSEHGAVNGAADEADEPLSIIAMIEAMVAAAKGMPSRIADALKEISRLEAAALEVQAKLSALDVAEKIKWDDARMQECKARAEIDEAKEEQRKRREAKARQRVVAAEAKAQEELARREAAQAAIGEEARRHARRSAKLPDDERPDEYLATWMKEKSKKGKGLKGGRAKAQKQVKL